MSWIDKILPSIAIASKGVKKSAVPEGTWKKCPRCDAMLYTKSLSENYEVCPKCEHHLRITARRRIELFLDAGAQIELNVDMEPVDLLKFWLQHKEIDQPLDGFHRLEHTGLFRKFHL